MPFRIFLFRSSCAWERKKWNKGVSCANPRGGSPAGRTFCHAGSHWEELLWLVKVTDPLDWKRKTWQLTSVSPVCHTLQFGRAGLRFQSGNAKTEIAKEFSVMFSMPRQFTPIQLYVSLEFHELWSFSQSILLLSRKSHRGLLKFSHLS